MTSPTASVRRWRNRAVGAALAIGCGLLALGTPLAHLSYDWLFRVRPPIQPEGVVVLYMDEPSHDALTQPRFAAWDRSVHAEMLNRLTALHAKAVVFDILWRDPATNDPPLLDAIRLATNEGTTVIVAGELKETHVSGQTIKQVVTPFEALESVAPWGVAESEGENLIHRLHSPGDGRAPSLSWRAAEQASSVTLPEPDTERWVNYYGPPGTIGHRSYHELKDARLDLSAVVSNQVCFVGSRPGTPFSGGLLVDAWRTPFSRWAGGRMPGVEVNATVYLNLVRGDWLKRWPGWAEALVIVFTGALLGAGLMRFRPTVAAGLGAAAALVVAASACVLTWNTDWWFPWMSVALVQAPVAVCWSALKSLDRRLDGSALVAAPDIATQPTVVDGARAADAPPPLGQPVLAIPDHALVRRVGKGAYGEVWLARNAIGTYHAVKIVRREDFEELGPFEREFRGIQRFMPLSRSHPGLVQILHVGRHEKEGFIYYVMEIADDEAKGQVIDPETYAPKNLAKEIRSRQRLSAAETLQLALDLTAALEFLHGQQLIHRDIKPANIIFVKGVPKFADIGLVTDVAAPGRDVTYLGTKGYIPPEGPGTPAADLFSLGKVLYEAGMGLRCDQFPELPQTLLQRSDAGALFQLNEIILKACQEDAAQRYRSAAEMRVDLLALQQRLSAAPSAS